MKSFLIFLTLIGIHQSLLANDVIATGKIGAYSIEMTVIAVDWETGEVEGKYRYANKTSYLTLKGQLYGSCIFLQEYYYEKETGQFYLDYEDAALRGKWISDNKALEVMIDWTDELSKKLMYKENEEHSSDINNTITGTYQTGDYFLNDMWLTGEYPSMEIGFNGGTALIEEIHPDSIHFKVMVVCGPTYHLAFADGKAVKTADKTYYCLYNAYEGDTCEIFLNFTPKATSIYAKSNNSFSCEFGARAYLEHDFEKTDNQVDFSDLED